MYERTHTNESPAVNMKNNFFRNLIDYFFEVTLQRFDTRLYLFAHLTQSLLKNIRLFLHLLCFEFF